MLIAIADSDQARKVIEDVGWCNALSIAVEVKDDPHAFMTSMLMASLMYQLDKSYKARVKESNLPVLNYQWVQVNGKIVKKEALLDEMKGMTSDLDDLITRAKEKGVNPI